MSQTIPIVERPEKAFSQNPTLTPTCEAPPTFSETLTIAIENMLAHSYLRLAQRSNPENNARAPEPLNVPTVR